MTSANGHRAYREQMTQVVVATDLPTEAELVEIGYAEYEAVAAEARLAALRRALRRRRARLEDTLNLLLALGVVAGVGALGVFVNVWLAAVAALFAAVFALARRRLRMPESIEP